MRNLIFVTATMALSILPSAAQAFVGFDELDEAGVAETITSSTNRTAYCYAADEYAFEDFGLTAYEDPVVQCGLTVQLKDSGFYIDVWHSEAEEVAGRETDFTVGRVWEANGLTWHAKTAYYAIPGPNITHFRLELSDVYDLQQDISVGWYTSVDAYAGLFEAGMVRSGGWATYEFADNWNAQVGLGGAYHQKFNERQKGEYLWSVHTTASISWTVNERLTLTPASVLVYAKDEAVGYDRRVAVSSGFSYSF